MTPFRTILAGTDGSVSATSALGQAIGLASSLGASLHIVSAYEPAAERRLPPGRVPPSAGPDWELSERDEVLGLLERAAELARAGGVAAVETSARGGDPADAILDVAEETGCDLIVIGHKGMTGATRFLLGSVPNKVSHHAPCSVLIVRTG